MHNIKMIGENSYFNRSSTLPNVLALSEVEVDSQGLSAKALKQTLESWPAGQKRPHVL